MAADATPAMIQEAIRADQERLQGTWALVSGAAGDESKKVSGDAKWIIAGNRIVMSLEERQEGAFSLDPAKSPRRIDIVPSSAIAKSEQIRGVYEVSGDVLSICLNSSDEAQERCFHDVLVTILIDFPSQLLNCSDRRQSLVAWV